MRSARGGVRSVANNATRFLLCHGTPTCTDVPTRRRGGAVIWSARGRPPATVFSSPNEDPNLGMVRARRLAFLGEVERLAEWLCLIELGELPSCRRRAVEARGGGRQRMETLTPDKQVPRLAALERAHRSLDERYHTQTSSLASPCALGRTRPRIHAPEPLVVASSCVCVCGKGSRGGVSYCLTSSSSSNE